jgi:hypothetical protein
LAFKGIAAVYDRHSAQALPRLVGLKVESANYCSEAGAQLLKTKIESYWRERGHQVSVILEDKGFHLAVRATRFDIRSDMINGAPRSVHLATSGNVGADETASSAGLLHPGLAKRAAIR